MFICSAAAAIHVRIAIASPPSSALRVSGFQNAAACNGVHQPGRGRRSQILQRGLVKKFCLLFAPFRMNYFVYAIMCFVSTDFECNPGILIIHTIFLQTLSSAITQVSSIIRVLKRNQARGEVIVQIYTISE